MTFNGPLLRQFSISYLAYLVIYCARKPFSVVKAALQDDIGLTLSSITTIETGFLLTYALGMFFLVSFAEKVGIIHSLSFIYMMSAVCLVIFGSNSDPVVSDFY